MNQCVSIILIALLGGYLQGHLFLNHDVSWLMEAAEKLLQGGSYTTQFFDNNPPLIIYLSTIPILISQFFNISQITSLILFVISLIVASSLLCRHYLQLLLTAEEDKPLKNIILFTLVITLSLCFSYDYGQREHLTIMLIFPYFILASLRIEKKPVDGTIILSALMAGIGFMVKPYFLLCYLFIELFIVWRLKSIRAFFRAENLIILMIFFSYIPVIIYFSPEYFTDVFPFSLYIHGLERNITLSVFLNNLHNLHFFIALMAIFFLWQEKSIRSLSVILYFALICFSVIFFIQGKGWFYHLLPATLISYCLIMQGGYLSYRRLKKITRLININLSQVFSLTYLFFAIAVLFIQINFHSQVISHLFQIKNNTMSYENKVIDYINQRTLISTAGHDQQYFYFISTSIYYNALLSRYSNAVSANRFPYLWLLLPSLNSKQAGIDSKQYKINQQAKQVMMYDISEDIECFKPIFIFVAKHTVRSDITIDSNAILKLLIEDRSFAQIWQSYEKVDEIEHHIVYQRK